MRPAVRESRGIWGRNLGTGTFPLCELMEVAAISISFVSGFHLPLQEQRPARFAGTSSIHPP